MLKLESFRSPYARKWESIRKLNGGWNAFDDPQDIDDNQFADVQNVTFDKGYPAPRKGSQLKWTKPTGETNTILNLFAARASDGTNYTVAAYAPNFYFRDETNDQWIKINQGLNKGTFTVTSATPAVFSFTGHGLIAGDAVHFTTTGALYTGLTVGTIYYVIAAGLTADAFEVSATHGGTAVNTSGSQSGTHTLYKDLWTPTTTYKGLYYGYTNWNAGISADVLYAGNGTESNIKWPIAFSTIAVTTGASDSTLTLTDATKFPATGYIVIKVSGGTEVYKNYTAKSGNTLTLNGTVGSIIASGAGVTMQLMQSGMLDGSSPKLPIIGKIFTKFQGRMIVANKTGAETTVYGSILGNPEDFTVDTTEDKGFSTVITDGSGGISGVDVFGEYLLIEKDDSMHKLNIDTNQYSDGTSTKLIKTLPVVSDISMGPVQPWARIKKNNLIYYATATEGILSVNPTVTGQQMSVDVAILSQPIQPYVVSLDFTDSRTTSFNQKILWSAKKVVTSDTIVVYDLLRNIWTRFTGWQVKDWLLHNKKLYFGATSDNNIYEAFTDVKLDGEFSYETFALSKRFDLTQSSLPKTMAKIFMSGYISQAEVLKFDVILITGDKIVTIPYQIKGNGSYLVGSIPKALAMYMMGLFTLGMVKYDLDEVTGLFKVYLAIPLRYGFFTLQIKTYSTVNGTDWGWTGMGFPPLVEDIELKPPQTLTIGTIGDETNVD